MVESGFLNRHQRVLGGGDLGQNCAGDEQGASEMAHKCLPDYGYMS